MVPILLNADCDDEPVCRVASAMLDRSILASLVATFGESTNISQQKNIADVRWV